MGGRFNYGKLDREKTEALTGSVHDVTAQKSFVSIAALAGERPSWPVDSLGSVGVPFSRVEDFVPPPEASSGALFLELQPRLLRVYARRMQKPITPLQSSSWRLLRIILGRATSGVARLHRAFGNSLQRSRAN